jgi:DNA-binding LacI/PurR family transcriptional regulator
MSARQEDIAQHLSISVSTVSLALRDSPLIAEETRQQVKEAAAQLGYVHRPRSVSAVDLVKLELKQLAFIIPFPSNNVFYAGLLNSAESECRRLHLALHYILLEDLNTHVLMQGKAADALILVGAIDEQSVQRFVSLGRPCILVDNNLPHLGLDQVLTENVGSLYRTVMRLHELGHERIAFLRGDDTSSSLRERRQGYHAAMATLGLETLEFHCPGNQLLSTGEAVMTQWLSTHEKLEFTALIGCNDDAAIGALHALRNHGIRVSEEVSIVGFDDVDTAQAVWPPLTTNHVHRQLMGEKAVQLLIKRAKDPDAPCQSLVLGTTFIERASTRSLR